MEKPSACPRRGMRGGRLNLSPLYYRVSPERIPQMSDFCAARIAIMPGLGAVA